MATLSLQDFKIKLPDEVKEFEGVGKVTRRDVGLEEYESLKRFYDKNYYPGYILSNKELFSWMFKNNGGCVATLWYNDEIVAHQGHVPVVFTDGINDYKGFISASTMVDALYRRKGLMSYLRGNVQDRYQMAVSIGGSAQGVALYSAMGYKLYGDLIRLIAIVDPKKCLGIAKNAETLKRTVELNSEKNGSVRFIDNFKDISEELDLLRHKVLPPKTYFGVKRDAEFLDWRYTDHPIFEYQRFGLWQKGGLGAVIVFRHEFIAEANQTTIRITELLGEEKALGQLIKATVLTEEIAKNTGWIDWFCANKKISESIKSLGFKSPEELAPAEIPILCNPIDYNKKKYPFMFWAKDENWHSKVPSLDQWYITKGDGDADRPNTAEGYVKP